MPSILLMLGRQHRPSRHHLILSSPQQVAVLCACVLSVMFAAAVQFAVDSTQVKDYSIIVLVSRL